MSAINRFQSIQKFRTLHSKIVKYPVYHFSSSIIKRLETLTKVIAFLPCLFEKHTFSVPNLYVEIDALRCAYIYLVVIESWQQQINYNYLKNIMIFETPYCTTEHKIFQKSHVTLLLFDTEKYWLHHYLKIGFSKIAKCYKIYNFI